MRRTLDRTPFSLTAALAALALIALAAAPAAAATFQKDMSVLTADGANWISISVTTDDASLVEDYTEDRFEVLPIPAARVAADEESTSPRRPTPWQRPPERRKDMPVVQVTYDLSSVELPEGVAGYDILVKPPATKPGGVGLDKPEHWQQDIWELGNAWGCDIKVEAKSGCHTALAFNGTDGAYHSPIFLRSQCSPQWISSIATWYTATAKVDYSGLLYHHYKITLSGSAYNVYYWPGGF